MLYKIHIFENNSLLLRLKKNCKQVTNYYLLVKIFYLHFDLHHKKLDFFTILLNILSYYCKFASIFIYLQFRK